MKLEITNITKRYGSLTALENASISFETGHITGLFGRNGAGKSTLIKCIGNRISPDSGLVTLDGTPLSSSSTVFGSVFTVGEENMLPSSMKIRSVYALMDDLGKGDRRKAEALSGEFRLDTGKRWDRLSTGYRTIFKDILALSSSAPFVFFDEPVLGLDAAHRELFYEKLLSSFREDRCLIVATHLIDEIASLVDSVTIIDRGRVLTSGDREKMLEDLYYVSGREEDVNRATVKAHQISRSVKLGKTVALVRGEVDRNESVTVEGVDLQKYFVELTKESVYEY